MQRDVKQGLGNSPDAPKSGESRLRAAGETGGWELAVSLTERWLATRGRVDALLEELAAGATGRERARAQQLFYGVVRWASLLESALEGLMTHPPRTKVRALLLVAGFELWEQGAGSPSTKLRAGREQGEGNAAKIIHHAVEKAKTVASAPEARLVNAVARKVSRRLAEERERRTEAADPAALAMRWAHPEWLVTRWTGQFGLDTTRKLLEWNQRPAPVYARWRIDPPVPDCLGPTQWPDFYEVKAGRWEEVRRLAGEGALYLQDPSTRLCVELLGPKPGEIILDACAAPGGKSLFIADRMKEGRVVALDEPAPPGKTDLRLTRLKENLSRSPAGVQVAMVEADLQKVNTDFYLNLNLPPSYDAVLLDAPCSNTGVMRHRIDVKWRLQDGDFARHADQQLALIRAAARLVKPGGRLVYSTCSIDAGENEGVVERFLRAAPGWKKERSVQAYPWTDGHDGAGACLLQRVSG